MKSALRIALLCALAAVSVSATTAQQANPTYAPTAGANVGHPAKAGANVGHPAKAGANVGHPAKVGANVGGVTSALLLHGSADMIGGQAVAIKTKFGLQRD
jgi:hypothetical protein